MQASGDDGGTSTTAAGSGFADTTFEHPKTNKLSIDHLAEANVRSFWKA